MKGISRLSRGLQASCLSLAVLAITGCHQGPAQSFSEDPNSRGGFGLTSAERVLGEGNFHTRVIGGETFRENVKNNQVVALRPPDQVPQNSLLLEYPVGLIGEQNVFGAVITKVSDGENVQLGDIKLADLPPIHVKTVLTGSGDKTALTLYGCAENCTEKSPQLPLIGIPVVGKNDSNHSVVVDLSSLGATLDLMAMMDPGGSYTHLVTKEAVVTGFDFSQSTLVFDIESRMVPADKPDSAVTTVITSRWYMRLASAFNPAFVPRPATPGIGFFMTERSAESKIQRWSLTATNSAPVHYYIKNVPDRWKKAFSGSFDGWNANLRPIIGRDLLSYEFIDAGDPRSQTIVTGDVRYNVLEWDMVNKASYGGLGPSIANQFTGEMLSANVLIQGPTIMDLYTKWYHVNQAIQNLKAQGRTLEAQKLVLNFEREKQALMSRRTPETMTLRLTKALPFQIPARQKPYEDPAMDKKYFDDTPVGYDFDTYMNGYFTDMVEHELGHNLGLRHNFRGNLGAGDSKSPGQVSRSVMEYLNRTFRYLDHIGEYDVMAQTYALTGAKPAHTNWFCTDEDVVDAQHVRFSAECSRDDGTNDPYSWYESRLAKAIDYLVARGTPDAPVWTVGDMKGELGVALIGIVSYGASAESTGAGWTNFYSHPDRPKDLKSTKAWVGLRLKAQLCDPSLNEVINSKKDDAARNAVKTNLETLRAAALSVGKAFRAYGAADLKCD